MALTVVLLGSLVVEYFTERKQLSGSIPELIDALQGKDARGLAAVIENSGLLQRQKAAVLELVSSDFFYHRYPEMPEGRLTKIRASFVCEPALAYCAEQIPLGDYLLLGKGEEQTGGRFRPSVVSDAMEALIGAIYLDSSIQEARSFIHRFILNDIEGKQYFYDAKTILQEEVQKQEGAELSYELLSEDGPDHRKRFSSAVLLNGKELARGEGGSKKRAEQQAAFEALKGLGLVVTGNQSENKNGGSLDVSEKH